MLYWIPRVYGRYMDRYMVYIYMLELLEYGPPAVIAAPPSPSSKLGSRSRATPIWIASAGGRSTANKNSSGLGSKRVWQCGISTIKILDLDGFRIVWPTNVGKLVVSTKDTCKRQEQPKSAQETNEIENIDMDHARQTTAEDRQYLEYWLCHGLSENKVPQNWWFSYCSRGQRVGIPHFHTLHVGPLEDDLNFFLLRPGQWQQIYCGIIGNLNFRCDHQGLYNSIYIYTCVYIYITLYYI